MARKGERYSQVPTLWHCGWGYPCHVMRRRRVRSERTGRWMYRWANDYHDVLTMATAMRWKRLEAQGKAQVCRDTAYIAYVQMGIARKPERAEWAAGDAR